MPMEKNTQVQEFDLRMTRNDPMWTNRNKKALQSIEMLVKSLDLAGFGRNFQEFLQLAEYLSLRVFGAGRKQNILGARTR